MTFLNYISAFRNVYKEIKIQQRYNKSFLIPYLKELEDKYNGKFAAEQKNKILKYYGLFIASFLCSSYKRLYGKKLTEDERTRATLFGILTPVGDDLFDIDNLDINSVRKLTYEPSDFDAVTFSAKVVKEIQSFELNHVADKEIYLSASKDVLDIQIETIKQRNPDISVSELERITYTKGAVSVIIYHQSLDDLAGREMIEVLKVTGSLYQLGNDIFDLYKDVRDNIYTLVNTCHDFEVFRKNFIDRVRLQNSLIGALPYHQKNKEEFCIIINTINARSLVAIDQLVHLQHTLKKKIDWWQLERKDMIVDMEKAKNILKWLKYIYTVPKL